jgi:hypothetical protein
MGLHLLDADISLLVFFPRPPRRFNEAALLEGGIGYSTPSKYQVYTGLSTYRI